MYLMMVHAALCGSCSVTGDILSQSGRESMVRTQIQSQETTDPMSTVALRDYESPGGRAEKGFLIRFVLSVSWTTGKMSMCLLLFAFSMVEADPISPKLIPLTPTLAEREVNFQLGQGVVPYR